MAYKVFIDGQAGTTGLRLAERLAGRADIELIEIAVDARKDTGERLSCIAAADVSVLCLPDDGSREIVAALDAAASKSGPDSPLAKSRIIDCSTAFRTAPGWTYGIPEIVNVDAHTKRVANPGCHATGFILAVRPLINASILDPAAPLSFHSLTGYSGGGKTMIAEYEAPGRGAEGTMDPLAAPRQYGLSQGHKHLPEIEKYAGVQEAPVFTPIVCDFYNGMLVSVPLPGRIQGAVVTPSGNSRDGAASQHDAPWRIRYTPEQIHDALAAYYSGCPLVKVRTIDAAFSEVAGSGYLSANAFANRDDLEIFVTGAADRIEIVVRYDNLGKGASGAAIQNMNLMLGLPPQTGLVLGD